jgi:fucose permease
MCAVFHGFGSGAIDAGLNHYVAHHFSARHMNWLHACFSIGAALGPFTMTMVLTSGTSWRAGYFIVAAVLATLAVLFACTAKRWNDASEDMAGTSTPRQTVTLAQALRNGTVWRHIALFFIYTGLEALVGQWAFTLLTESRGISTATAGSWVVFYWASIAVGRVLFGFVVERLGVDRLLRLGMLMALCGTALFAWNVSNIVSSSALILTGLGLAPIFPCMMTRTPVRLGAGIAAHAIGFQVSAAMLGAAALPATCGLLAVNIGLEAIPVVALVAAALVFAIHEILLRGDRIDAQLRASTANDTEHP